MSVCHKVYLCEFIFQSKGGEDTVVEQTEILWVGHKGYDPTITFEPARSHPCPTLIGRYQARGIILSPHGYNISWEEHCQEA